jgi:hypothetical protein
VITDFGRSALRRLAALAAIPGIDSEMPKALIACRALRRVVVCDLLFMFNTSSLLHTTLKCAALDFDQPVNLAAL